MTRHRNPSDGARAQPDGFLQGSWGIGFLLSFAIYGLFYNTIGWRGMLIAGVLPAFAVLYVRFFVKEPEVWLENRRLQKAQKREVKVPLLSIFKRGMIGNTLTACWWMASGFITYYSVTVLFATHLQVDLKMTPGAIGEVGVAANLVTFLSSVAWGWVADKYGRRAAMIIPAVIAIPLAPMYLLSSNFTLIWWLPKCDRDMLAGIGAGEHSLALILRTAAIRTSR